MRILSLYRRVLSSLGADRRLAVVLSLANIVLAGLQFLDPVLFGRVIGLLSKAADLPRQALWAQAALLIGIWMPVAAVSIGGNLLTVVQAERLSHRNRLKAMSRLFTHVLSLPLSFHGGAHSGRLIKVMLTGTDALFGVWLNFFRDQLTTYVALLVLLPLTMLMNWQLASVLMVLVVLFAGVTLLVIRRTEAGQARAETQQSRLASTAQDALANVMVVQSFTRAGGRNRRVPQDRRAGDGAPIPGAELVGGGDRAHPRRVHHRGDRHRAGRHRVACARPGQHRRNRELHGVCQLADQPARLRRLNSPPGCSSNCPSCRTTSRRWTPNPLSPR